MFSGHRKSLKSGALLLCFSISVSGALAAQPLTSPEEVQEWSVATSTPRLINPSEKKTVEERNTQIEDLSRPSEPASGQLLDDEELAQLVARAEEPGEDVVGGALSNQKLTYVVIALAAAVVVLIAK